MKKDKNQFRVASITVIVVFILSLTLPFYRVTSAAESTEIKFRINGGASGEVKSGENVEISVDLNNITNFFAGSVDYTYDNTLLEVSSIELNPKFNEHKILPAYDEVAKGGNIARYAFTILGEDSGISGSIRFITIKGKAKRSGNVVVNQDNVKYMIVNKENGELKDLKSNIIFNNGMEKSVETSENPTSGTNTGKSGQAIDSNESVNSSGDSAGASSNETNSSGTAQPDANNQENIEGTAEGSDSLEKSFDESDSKDNDSNNSEDTSDKDNDSNSNRDGYIYLSLTLGFIVIVGAVGTFVYKKKKKIV